MQKFARSKHITQRELYLSNYAIDLITEINLRKEFKEYIKLHADEIAEKAIFSKKQEPVTGDMVFVLELRFLDFDEMPIPAYHSGPHNDLMKSLPRAEFPEKEE